LNRTLESFCPAARISVLTTLFFALIGSLNSFVTLPQNLRAQINGVAAFANYTKVAVLRGDKSIYILNTSDWTQNRTIASVCPCTDMDQTIIVVNVAMDRYVLFGSLHTFGSYDLVTSQLLYGGVLSTVCTYDEGIGSETSVMGVAGNSTHDFFLCGNSPVETNNPTLEAIERSSGTRTTLLSSLPGTANRGSLIFDTNTASLYFARTEDREIYRYNTQTSVFDVLVSGVSGGEGPHGLSILDGVLYVGIFSVPTPTHCILRYNVTTGAFINVMMPGLDACRESVFLQALPDALIPPPPPSVPPVAPPSNPPVQPPVNPPEAAPIAPPQKAPESPPTLAPLSPPVASPGDTPVAVPIGNQPSSPPVLVAGPAPTSSSSRQLFVVGTATAVPNATAISSITNIVASVIGVSSSDVSASLTESSKRATAATFALGFNFSTNAVVPFDNAFSTTNQSFTISQLSSALATFFEVGTIQVGPSLAPRSGPIPPSAAPSASPTRGNIVGDSPSAGSNTGAIIGGVIAAVVVVAVIIVIAVFYVRSRRDQKKAKAEPEAAMTDYGKISQSPADSLPGAAQTDKKPKSEKEKPKRSLPIDYAELELDRESSPLPPPFFPFALLYIDLFSR
jgi:hypothetical protein